MAFHNNIFQASKVTFLIKISPKSIIALSWPQIFSNYPSLFKTFYVKFFNSESVKVLLYGQMGTFFLIRLCSHFACADASDAR